MTVEFWRDLSCKSPYWNRDRDRINDPIQHARMRFEQNIIAGLEECGYQRQTGRTFRTLIRALQAIEAGQTVLILASSAQHTCQLHEQLSDWIEETCTNKASHKSARLSSLSIRHIMDRNERRVVATIAPLQFNISKQLPTNYDLVLLDNIIVDEIMKPQICGNSMMSVCDVITEIEHHRMTQKNLCFNVSSFVDGSSWHEGDLFHLPKSGAVGTLASIKRVGRIPISLTVLYEGNLLELPWDTCDIFHRVSSLS